MEPPKLDRAAAICLDHSVAPLASLVKKDESGTSAATPAVSRRPLTVGLGWVQSICKSCYHKQYTKNNKYIPTPNETHIWTVFLIVFFCEEEKSIYWSHIFPVAIVFLKVYLPSHFLKWSRQMLELRAFSFIDMVEALFPTLICLNSAVGKQNSRLSYLSSSLSSYHRLINCAPEDFSSYYSVFH